MNRRAIAAVQYYGFPFSLMSAYSTAQRASEASEEAWAISASWASRSVMAIHASTERMLTVDDDDDDDEWAAADAGEIS